MKMVGAGFAGGTAALVLERLTSLDSIVFVLLVIGIMVGAATLAAWAFRVPLGEIFD